MIEAEANFIQQTRTDQSGDLGRVLGEIKKEAGDEDFRKKVREGIKADNDLIKEMQSETSNTERIRALEEDIKQLKEQKLPSKEETVAPVAESK